ncbi:hypothetical protein EZV62_017171 [Acer yangbiense]|uniref:Uncharacterized protein n=1 Tax=Acer yangbiense TaxID=1000413 RepID=A0A5C7HGG2_9ROSI|nr:hypothetical protein EZV62_017171 [Acer yangbiense]
MYIIRFQLMVIVVNNEHEHSIPSDAELVIEVLKEMKQQGCPPNDVICSATISGMCKSGTLEQKTAGLVLSGLKFSGFESKSEEKGCSLLPSWNCEARMQYWMRQGKFSEISDLRGILFDVPQMKSFEFCIRPQNTTLVAITSATDRAKNGGEHSWSTEVKAMKSASHSSDQSHFHSTSKVKKRSQEFITTVQPSFTKTNLMKQSHLACNRFWAPKSSSVQQVE